MSTLLPYLVRFPIWWYAHQSRWWLTFATRTLLLAIDKVAILPQLKSLFSPYHDDRTFVGRALGVCFRLTWISGGIFILLLIGIAIVGGYLLWLVWPLSFIW